MLWVAILAGLAYWKSDSLCTLSLNEWGDFLAGACAPLAFLWLVVGYRQQGEELQHSTDALRLQAHELQNSVNQQRALVEVTRLQLESERKASAMVQRSQTEAAKPRFVVTCICQESAFNRSNRYDIVVENTGSTVRQVSGYLEEKDLNKRQIFNEQIFETSKKLPFSRILSIEDTETGTALEIRYADMFGNHGSCRYSIHKKPRDFPVIKLLEA